MKKANIKKTIIYTFILIIAIMVPSDTILSLFEYFDDVDAPLGVYCSAKDAGMFPNDEKRAKENGNIFISTLNKYGGIVIDDTYYIGTPKEKLTSRDIEIIGLDGAELISSIHSGADLFSPRDLDNLTIRNVKFSNPNENKNFLIVYDPVRTDTKVKNVVIENCIFTGNISVYRQYGDTTLDPEIVDFGIDTFIFANNKVYNTNISFIVLTDVPVTGCKVNNNTIQNFNYTFLKIAITNDIPYEQDLYNHIRYLEVDSNTVICDDDWWGETNLATYYAFVLYEGMEVLYNNNHVEGLKALEDIALYDAYLSAHIVNYTNNVWKNNICFAADKTNNTLLKSKSGGERPLIRNYSNNTFIVEEDFAERLGQQKDNLKVNFISLTHYAESYKIDNNIFDIYDIRFPKSSLMIGNYVFSNNTLKAEKASGKLAVIRLSDEYSTEKIEIVNNNIVINEKTDESISLVYIIDTRENRGVGIDSVVVDDNHITAPFGYLFYGLNSSYLEFKNNEITDITNEHFSLAYNGKLINSVVQENKILNSNSQILYEGNSYAEIEQKVKSY